MDGWVGGWMDVGWIDGWMDRLMDTVMYKWVGGWLAE